MLALLKITFSNLRYTLLLLGCLLNVFQAALVFAADPTGMCDPTDPNRQANILFLHSNDVLYYDECAPTCNSTSGSTLPGDNNAERAYNYLISHGWTPPQAAGIVGNMIAESGVNPEREQGSGLNDQTPATTAVSNPAGWGIVQWTPASKMIQPTQSAGQDPNDLGVQLDFLNNELSTNEKSAGDAVRATNNVDASEAAFESQFERHAVDASGSARQTYAEAIYNKAVNGTPYPPAVEAAIYTGSGGSAASSTGTSASGAAGCNTTTATDDGQCKNPFRDLKNSGASRIDGGYDYGGSNGSGPIYPACPAIIDGFMSGWPGSPGSYIRYKITAGKAQGLYMYISEDCTPKVKVGDVVTTDTNICDYVNHGTQLETGWGQEGGTSSYVSWSDYPAHDHAGQNGWAANSGVDVDKFLQTLGLPHNTIQLGPSQQGTPAGWPKW